MTSQLMGKHTSSPDWLLGVVEGLPWSRLGIEHLRTEVSSIATNISACTEGTMTAQILLKAGTHHACME